MLTQVIRPTLNQRHDDSVPIKINHSNILLMKYYPSRYRILVHQKKSSWPHPQPLLTTLTCHLRQNQIQNIYNKPHLTIFHQSTLIAWWDKPHLHYKYKIPR